MKDGDAVLVVADTEDGGSVGILRGEAEVTVGARTYVYRIVRFEDGHEGAYTDEELQVVEKAP
jgi:hypothetical protein